MNQSQQKELNQLVTEAVKLPYCDLQIKRHDSRLVLVELTLRAKPERLAWVGWGVNCAVKALDKK